MSNYRVRQVLALGRMPERQLRLLVALATWLPDDSRSVRVGLDEVTAAAGNARNTVRAARRELEGDGRLSSIPGRYRGDRTLWTVWCLPEKGVRDVDPLPTVKGVKHVDPLPVEEKGVNPSAERGSTAPGKGGQPERADQRKPERRLNRQAQPSGSINTLALVGASADPYASLSGFAEFWNVYPNKQAKRAAAKAYQSALSRISGHAPDPAALLIKAAARYRDDPLRISKYTKHPATWLNGDCWNDEPEQQQSSTDRNVAKIQALKSQLNSTNGVTP